MNMNKQNKNTIIFSVVLIIGLSIGAVLFFDYWKENRAKTIDENYCNQYQPDFCPDGCIVCPPCPECSSIQCRLASSCEAMGFDKDWYQPNDCLKHGGYCAKECKENDGVVYLKGCSSGQVCCMAKESYVGCKDLCGDGICQEIVCLAIGCPCAETKGSCPQDCK